MFVRSNEEGVERVRTSSGKYAFLTSSETIDYYSTTYPCDTIRVGQKIDSTFYGLVFPLNSPYKLVKTNHIPFLLDPFRSRFWLGSLISVKAKATVCLAGQFHQNVLS